jgi:hypothetical protein
MKKFSKKGMPFAAAAMTLCLFAMPSSAGASSWGVVNSEHTLDGANIGFRTTVPSIGRLFGACSKSSFTGDVRSAGDMSITNATFGGHCVVNLPDSGDGQCTLTLTGTRFPWTATAVTTTNIQIHGVQIDERFIQNTENSCPGALAGQSVLITGTLRDGHWTGNGTNEHEIFLDGAEGLVVHSALGNNIPMTWYGYLADTAKTLIVTG